MTPEQTQLVLLIAGLLLTALFSYLLCIFIAAYFIYTRILRRNSKDQWARAVSSQDPRSLKMDDIGMAWFADHRDKKTDVHIVREGVNLYGEYFDFGFDRCVMILSGRTESLRYGYFFAAPYEKAGYNVLVVDPRAHGESDGRYNTLGFEESKDAIAWVTHIHDIFNVRSFVFHGICIGAAGGILALTSPDCPSYVDGMVAEGMFIRFAESMKNNLKKRKRLMFPVLFFIDLWMRFFTGHTMFRGPLNVIGRLEKPLLMLHSREDQFSTPHNAQKLFDACGSQKKQLVWFDKGDHSMLRITAMDKYDAAITAFLDSFIR